MQITIRKICRGGWAYEASYEPELFAPPILARGRGRSLREAVGDLIFQAQRETNTTISVLVDQKAKARLRRAG